MTELTGSSEPTAAEPAGPDLSARLRPRGSNHVGMRQFNERVVLQAIRLNGSLPKADLARLTGLTAQTVGLITTRLDDDGLLVRHEPVRGRIGQPSVPLGLNPEINSHLHAGLHGNAGAVASVPLNVARPGEARPEQLVHQASLWELEQRLEARGLDATTAYDERAMKTPSRKKQPPGSHRAAECPGALHRQRHGILDLDAIVLDGSFCRPLLQRLMEHARLALAGYNWEGLWPPDPARRQHRPGCAGAGRRPAAAARKLCARPGSVPQGKRLAQPADRTSGPGLPFHAETAGLGNFWAVSGFPIIKVTLFSKSISTIVRRRHNT